jgi:hypothetical protein
MGLELLNPKGLWLLTGLVPLVVMYILKIRRQRVRVPSTWLWQAAQRDLLAKQPFKRLLAELPLILQIIALIALAIALSRPALRGGKIAGDHVAIVIDTSASMGTLVRGGAPGPDGAPATRMTEARRAAADVVSALAPGADALVIEGAKEARVVAPLERDERHLKAAAASVAVRDVEGDLSAAVALAADRLRSLPGKKRIVVITDGALAHDTPLSAAGSDLQVITVGDDAENAGIVRVDVRSGIDPSTKKEQVQVFAMVKNYGTKARDVFVTLSLQSGATSTARPATPPDPIASRRMLVPPNDKSPVVLTFEPKSTDHGAGIVVQLSPGDALAIDDVAYGRVPTGLKMPVTLASSLEYSWVQRALEADPTIDLRKLTLEQLTTVNIEPDAFVVVEGACPDPLPGQDAMIIAPPAGSCLGLDVAATIDNPQITSWESGDPRLRFLTLDGVLIAKSAQLKAQGAGASLIRAPTTTLVADASVPGRMLTLVGFDVADSNWPLKASFVLFVRNVVELARLHRAQGVAGPARTGEPLRIAVPTGTESIVIEGPGMPTGGQTVGARLGFAIVPPLERAGLYALRWTAPHVGGAIVSANLTSEKESDVRPRPVLVDANGGAGAASVPASKVVDAHNEWGSWLALLAALVILFDVWWLTRKPRAPVIESATVATPTRGA